MDGNPSLDNYERYDVIVGHNPSGTSLMNLIHWQQLFETKTFRSYDHGSKEANKQKYGLVYPPDFQLEQISKPMRFFYGFSDLAADFEDVEYMWGKLNPNVKNFMKGYNAGHATFVWGKDTSTWMADLLKMLSETPE